MTKSIYRPLTPYLDLHTLNLESSVGSMQPRNWNALSKSKLFLKTIGFVPTDQILNNQSLLFSSRRGVHCCDVAIPLAASNPPNAPVPTFDPLDLLSDCRPFSGYKAMVPTASAVLEGNLGWTLPKSKRPGVR